MRGRPRSPWPLSAPAAPAPSWSLRGIATAFRADGVLPLVARPGRVVLAR
ncbi:hypothetical protein GTU99_14240 [Streptomyces sp. PRKS01-65]|nr:hypothetical protein [Streptomyces harenosi]NEY33336.1 hypothetical protein [Streptomyces harenosi]